MTPDVVVVGGSVAGIATALFYADAGADVVVFDSDFATDVSAPVTGDLPHRRWTPQDRHSHVLLARGHNVLATRAPAALDELRAAGAVERMPSPDPEVVGVMCRRTLLDRVLRDTARHTAGVQLVNATVQGLGIGGDGSRVIGVATDGPTVAAGLVVDATGRRAPMRSWLRDRGVATPEPEQSSCGVTYLTAFFRIGDWPDAPLNRGYAAGGFGAAGACLAFPTDNGLLSVTLGFLPGHPLIRPLMQLDRFLAVARLHPLVAPWIDAAKTRPCTDVALMSGLRNQWLRPPEIDGYVAVGDAACTTNPAYGRGMSLALLHAAAIVDTITPGARGVPPLAQATLDQQLRGWFDDSVGADALRTARWMGDALPDDPLARTVEAAQLRAADDPVVARALLRRFNLLDDPRAILDTVPVVDAASCTRPVWTPGPPADELARAARSDGSTYPTRDATSAAKAATARAKSTGHSAYVT